MMIWKWINNIKKRKQEHLNQIFAEKIREKYEWKWRERYEMISLRYRHMERAVTLIRQTDTRQVEQLIQKYLPKITQTVTPVVSRQERTRLLTVIEQIGRQGGEQKQLEQLIFRRREEEWKKIIKRQEEEVQILRQEMIQQMKMIQQWEKKMREPDLDMDRIYKEIQKRMEQTLRLERLRSGW